MAKLVRDDGGGKAERVADLVQVIVKLMNECFFGAWTGQEPDLPRSGRKRGSFLLKKNPTGREYSFLHGFLGV